VFGPATHIQAVSSRVCQPLQRFFHALAFGGSLSADVSTYRILRKISWAGLGENYSGLGPAGENVFLKRLPGVPTHLALRIAEYSSVLPARDEQGAWLISPGSEGESLRWVLTSLARAGGFLKPNEGLSVVERAAAALAALHQRGQLHGEVCAATVFISSSGEVSLSDLGVAAGLGVQAGNGPYRSDASALAPESLASPLTTQSDVFQLGALLFEMSMGKPLFAGATAAQVCLEAASWPGLSRDKVKHVPEPWQSLLLSMLSREPSNRPTSHEVAQVLGRAMEQHGWHAEQHVEPLFTRAGAGRPLSFSGEGQLVELELLAAPPPLSRATTPSSSVPRTTPVPLGRVATRKMSREALAAVRAEDVATAAPPSGEEPLDARVVRLLAERGSLTPGQAQQVKEAALRFRVPQTDALWRLGLCDEDTVVAVLAELTKTPSMTAKRVLEQIPGPEALSLIPAEVSRRARAVPLGLKGGAQLLVAMADPLDAEAINELKLAIGDKNLVTFRAGPKALAQCRARLYGESLEPAPDIVPGVVAGAPMSSELSARTIETLFRMCGARGAQAQSLVALTESLARLLDTAVETPRAVASALAAAALEKNRNPWDVPRLPELQDALGFGSEAESFAEAIYAFPSRIPDDGATRAVVLAFAFSAAAQDAKPTGSRLGGALGGFKTRAQLPPELFDALMRALS